MFECSNNPPITGFEEPASRLIGIPVFYKLGFFSAGYLGIQRKLCQTQSVQRSRSSTLETQMKTLHSDIKGCTLYESDVIIYIEGESQ